MDSEKWLWPSENMDFEKVYNTEYQVEVKWSMKPFLDYKNLSYQFYNCGFQVFHNVIKSGNDNAKSDMWFLTGIFMIRQSMELGLKALICRIYKKKSDIQSVFIKCCHNLSALLADYYSFDKENYITHEERQWLQEYLISLELVDAQSDMFRFPFEGDFLSKYRNKFIDNVDVANNLLQAFSIIKKCIECGTVSPYYNFKNNLKPEFFIMATHGIGNCYLWQSMTDEGFYVKIKGCIAVADFIFKNKVLHNEDKLYPLMFILRNALELSLKRLFYSRVDKGVSKNAFFQKERVT